MGLSSLSLAFVSMFILSKLVLFHLVVANSLQSYTPTCHDDENSALLQFKQSFVIKRSASMYDFPHQKISSWKSNSNCCSWDGIECDEETHHVIGLDLSSSYLYGSINSNNTIFRLLHLESLNLANNYFSSSQIPPTIRNFPKLRYLNLSSSGFSGQVPSEILQLTKLSSLDLSNNYGLFSNEELLRSVAQNLTGLETLDLSNINISSTSPNSLANFSHLTSLVLNSCGLFGKLPFSLGNLRHLIYLDLSRNEFNGQIPSSFANLTQLTYLSLSWNEFNGQIPSSFANLTQLTNLSLSGNEFNGQIPSSFADLTQLTYLSLSGNKFNGQIPSSFANLTQLTYFSLGENQINGTIPCSFGKLTQLATLRLNSNQLSGPIPSSLGNLGKLTVLDLNFNKFQREIPGSLFNVASLERLLLACNNLSGTVELLKLLKLPNLKWLDLSGNNLDVITETKTMNASRIPRLEHLGLASCNIREFPNFLRYQDTEKTSATVPKLCCQGQFDTRTLKSINVIPKVVF